MMLLCTLSMSLTQRLHAFRGGVYARACKVQGSSQFGALAKAAFSIILDRAFLQPTCTVLQVAIAASQML